MQALPNGRPGADVIARGGNNTWAPDVIRVGEKYFLYYSAPGTQPNRRSAFWSADARSGLPGLQMGRRRSGRLVRWRRGQQCHRPGRVSRSHDRVALAHIRFFGYIRLVELNPKTGKRLYPERKPVDIAINSEASIMIFREG